MGAHKNKNITMLYSLAISMDYKNEFYIGELT